MKLSCPSLGHGFDPHRRNEMPTQRVVFHRWSELSPRRMRITRKTYSLGFENTAFTRPKRLLGDCTEIARTRLSDAAFSKPFILLGEKWCAQGDDFRTFLGEFVACLPHANILD